MTRLIAASNYNTAVGALALINNVTGVRTQAWVQGVGPNLANGFNNTYIGNFVGTNAGDEDLTIRIGDVSSGRGRVCSLLHRWYLEQPTACWRQRCCSYSEP